MRSTLRTTVVVLAALATTGMALAEYRNGTFFDPGRQMTERAPGAPEELDRLVDFVGHWKVVIERPSTEGPAIKTSGEAEVTYMNRGHALMENFYSPDFGGQELAALRFFGFNPASQRWFLAGADNWTERTWVADGEYKGGGLVLLDARRPGGAVGRTLISHQIRAAADGNWTAVVETSDDGGSSWSRVEQRVYTRRESSPGSLKAAGTYGSPAPDRASEAAAFDFLVGEWHADHDMTFPNGQQAKWRANATAVYALNGAAILEFNWFDVDPSLPDAATTILRLYNRAARQWENLYIPNRGHSILRFGGVEEGDEIVLHPFDTETTAGLSKWVFHSVQEDAYKWYAKTSSDRGATWKTTWSIEFTRKKGDRIRTTE